MEIEAQEIGTEYNDLMNRITTEFQTSLGKANADKYMRGLLSPIERKNGWQMAEAMG